MMIRNKKFYNFRYDQEIYSPLAIIFLMVISLAVAMYCLAVAEEVIDNAKMSASFNIEVRSAQGKVK